MLNSYTKAADVEHSAPPPAPAAGACYGHGWRKLWPNFGVLFLTWLALFGMLMIGAIFDVIRDLITPIANDLDVLARVVLLVLLSLVSFAYSLFVINPLNWGFMYVHLKVVRGEEARVGDMFAVFKVNWWSVVGGVVLYGSIIVVGLILLIIPGIIFACRLAFMPYLVVDRRMGAFQALSESWSMTKGHAMSIFGIYLVAIPIAIAGLLLLVVGLIPAIMWINLAIGAMYYAVSARQSHAVAEAALSAPPPPASPS